MDGWLIKSTVLMDDDVAIQCTREKERVGGV
jgi:hypothetical protein